MSYTTENFDSGIAALTAKAGGGVTAVSGGVGSDEVGSENYFYVNTVTATTQVQVSKATAVIQTAHQWGVGVRQTTAATKGGYYGGHQHSEYSNWLYRIWKYSEANGLTDGIEHASQTVQAGDVVELRVAVNVDTTSADLELFVNGTSILTWTDSTAVLSGTRVGGIVFHSAAAVKLLDDFEGGDYSATPPAQTSVPSSDITANQWLPSTGGSLFAMVDETVADDADFIYTNTPSLCTLGLQSLTDPNDDTGHVVSYRARGDGALALRTKLWQGSAEIASWVTSGAPYSLTTYVQSLTTTQASSITNYADLRLSFEMF